MLKVNSKGEHLVKSHLFMGKEFTLTNYYNSHMIFLKNGNL